MLYRGPLLDFGLWFKVINPLLTGTPTPERGRNREERERERKIDTYGERGKERKGGEREGPAGIRSETGCEITTVRASHPGAH